MIFVQIYLIIALIFIVVLGLLANWGFKSDEVYSEEMNFNAVMIVVVILGVVWPLGIILVLVLGRMSKNNE